MSLTLDDLFEMGEFKEKREAYKVPAFCMPGSKVRSLDTLIPILDQFIDSNTIFVDCFGGTGAVIFNVKRCKNMIFNDSWSGIVDFYRCFLKREDIERLIHTLEFFPPHSREMWDRSAKVWVSETDHVLRAAYWYYMTRNSVIQKGKIFGRGIKTPFQPFPTCLDKFLTIHYTIQANKISLECLDVFTLIKDYDTPDTLFFMDPPYVDSDQSGYNETWNWDKMHRLLEVIDQLKGSVAFTHYPDVRISGKAYWTHFAEWERFSTTEPMTESGLDGKEGKNLRLKEKEKECLWIRKT